MESNWAEVRMQMDQMLDMERAQARLRRQHAPTGKAWRVLVLGLALLLPLSLWIL